MPILRQSAATPAEQELTQAVRRVYERYGKDLEAFFRHVRENLDMNDAEEEGPDSLGTDPASPEHGQPKT
jgi:hypothetical protein